MVGSFFRRAITAKSSKSCNSSSYSPIERMTAVRLPFFTIYSVSAVAVFMLAVAYHPGVLPARPRISDDAPELDAHGKEAVNFQISMLIYSAVSAVFCLVLVGFVFLAILWLLNAIFVIIAAIQARTKNSTATR
jgi:hypothetical protein